MTCIGPDCDRPSRAHGLCWGHLAQLRHGRALAPIRQPVDLDDVDHLAGCGESPHSIAARLGVTLAAIATAYRRAGRRHDAPPYDRAYYQQRRTAA